jgi:hypothetical protein
MMSKSLNYAYPQKFAEGGPVAGRPSDDAMLAALQNAGAEITYNAPLPPEPETPTASGSGSGLVDPETPTGYPEAVGLLQNRKTFLTLLWMLTAILITWETFVRVTTELALREQ